MREFTCELAGRELTLAANFKASLEVAKKVGDPVFIIREAGLEAMMIERGLTYNPKFKFTVENIPEIIAIGLKCAGSKMTRDEIDDLVFDAGFLQGKEVASEYLATIIGPAPEVELPKSDGDSGN